MTALQRAMVAEARSRYGAIRPCGSKRTLGECFTHEPPYGLTFWFNDTGGGTHVVRRPMSTAGGAGFPPFPAPPPLSSDDVEALR